MSAGGAAAIIPLCKAINPGWAFTLLALIYVFYMLLVFWIMKNGQRWRAENAEKKRAKAAEAAQAEENMDLENQSTNDSQSVHGVDPETRKDVEK